MAALDRAVAFAEREHGAVGVGEQLDLDMVGSLEVALQVDAIVAERGFRFTFRGSDRLVELAAQIARLASRVLRRRPRP